MNNHGYVFRIFMSISQLLNVILTNGNSKQTLSGNVGYMAHNRMGKRWKVAEWLINTLIFFHKNHCYRSIDWSEVE